MWYGSALKVSVVWVTIELLFAMLQLWEQDGYFEEENAKLCKIEGFPSLNKIVLFLLVALKFT
jgi:hypothetical protein